jgi:hypothetical protein
MKKLLYSLSAVLLLFAVYVGSYFVVPNPDRHSAFRSIHHPTATSRAYYRFYYPLRRAELLTCRKNWAGTLGDIDFAAREFTFMDSPTGGFAVDFSARQEADLRSLTPGQPLRIRVQPVPHPDAGAYHNELVDVLL